jgi:hypothetical protein
MIVAIHSNFTTRGSFFRVGQSAATRIREGTQNFDGRFGSVAVIRAKCSSMSAIGRIADTWQRDFESTRLNVRTHQERSFKRHRDRHYESPLSAKSRHSQDKKYSSHDRFDHWGGSYGSKVPVGIGGFSLSDFACSPN